MRGRTRRMVCSLANPHPYPSHVLAGMDVDGAAEDEEAPAPARTAYIPGSHTLGADEILEPDDSVYIMRHTMHVKWPCLSFDVLRDNLGDGRQRFPATAYIAAGTQADTAKNNELLVYKMSSLHRTQKDGGMELGVVYRVA